jgi:hypothetical protein
MERARLRATEAEFSRTRSSAVLPHRDEDASPAAAGPVPADSTEAVLLRLRTLTDKQVRYSRVNSECTLLVESVWLLACHVQESDVAKLLALESRLDETLFLLRDMHWRLWMMASGGK